jgi:nitrate reductase NapE component
MADEHWLTLHQADYSSSNRILGLKGFSIVAVAIFPWLTIAAAVGAVLQWW